MHLTTESSSHYDDLERMSTEELLGNMNREDMEVPLAINKEITAIGALIDAAFIRMEKGGRLFYIGSGTSGRLGIVDASECPPTYGVPHGLVIGIIAGGDKAIRKAVEFAEDDMEQAWRDLEEHVVTPEDFVIGVSASGTTPYVKGALLKCREQGISCGSIACNKNSETGAIADYPIEIPVGPEFVTGSTRMKAGTAQKLTLNMISTSLMIKLGRVRGNKMVDMQLSNAKLVNRGTKMVMESTGLNSEKANMLLLEAGSVRKAIEQFRKEKNQ